MKEPHSNLQTWIWCKLEVSGKALIQIEKKKKTQFKVKKKHQKSTSWWKQKNPTQQNPQIFASSLP